MSVQVGTIFIVRVQGCFCIVEGDLLKVMSYVMSYCFAISNPVLTASTSWILVKCALCFDPSSSFGQQTTVAAIRALKSVNIAKWFFAVTSKMKTLHAPMSPSLSPLLRRAALCSTGRRRHME